MTTARRIDLARWRAALADVSGRGFDDIASADVRLEGSAFALPVAGIDAVWRTLILLESLYDEANFIDEIVGKTCVVLPWEGHALGLTVRGITTLGIDGDSRVARVTVHHRPLGAVLLLAATLADRLPLAISGNGGGNGGYR